MTKDDIKIEGLKNAHQRSFKNERLKTNCPHAACFYCGRTFASEDVTEWITEPNASPDEDRTALCPFCEIDSVIFSETPVDPKFLRAMRRHWFG